MYAECAYPSVQDVTENAILDAGVQLKLLPFRGYLILLRGVARRRARRVRRSRFQHRPQQIVDLVRS